jgi:asparagine synthase (glutamine-hydrolysing)
MDSSEGRQVAVRMRDLMTHHANYVTDTVFCSEHICATRCHTDVLQKEPQPCVRNGVAVWLDGEFYNRQEVASQLGLPAETDAHLLHALYCQHGDFSLLSRIDGLFAAVVYDAGRRQVHLLTDRYGFRQLYWTTQGGRLAWTSEVKAMLGLPWFTPSIDERALEHFLQIGHFIFDRTWHTDVRALAQATVLTWDAATGAVRSRRYWWWDAIPPLPATGDRRELAEELGRLFKAAVRRRSSAGKPVGIELSGGLDSRAVFAAMPEGEAPLHAMTVGQKGCDEVRIAAAVARLKPNAVHHAFEIGAENWFLPRIEAVWQTDGCLNLRHMHNVCLRGEAGRYYDVYLCGVGVDTVRRMGQFEPTEEAFLASLRSRYHQMPELLTPEFVRANEQDLLEHFRSLGSAQALGLEWLMRRFQVHYVRPNRVDGVECRLPFLDNALQEFLFSIPLPARRDPRFGREDALYKEMLLRTFPAYYQTIPYQKTGIPISWPDPGAWVSNAVCGMRRIRNRVEKELKQRSGVAHSRRTGYQDYPAWIRQEPARSFFGSLLLNSSALYRAYASQARVAAMWEEHLRGKDHAERLCRYVTLELWLQQVFEGRYRRLGSEEADGRVMEINHRMEASQI